MERRNNFYGETAFILTSTGYRMPHDSVYRRIRHLASVLDDKEIGSHITTHYLRHCIASHLIEQGADLEWTQAFLGHSNVDSTHVYIRNRKIKKVF